MKLFSYSVAILVLFATASPVPAADPGMVMNPHSLRFIVSDWTQCELESVRFDRNVIFCDEEYCEVTVSNFDIHVYHNDAMFNCCIDDIDIVVQVDGNIIRIFENELFTNPCYCTCCYDTYTDIYNLKPGEYDVEVWTIWMDGESSLRCEETVIVNGF